MIKKLHLAILFRWFDLWTGFYIDRKGKAVYICLVPMFPIKIWSTEHKRCPTCGKAMQKAAVNTGDGWALFWDCDDYDGDDHEIDWPFGDRKLNEDELEREGYEII
jgi:hypothetical protein